MQKDYPDLIQNSNSASTYFKASGSGFLLEIFKNADGFVIFMVDSRPPKYLLQGWE